MFVCQHLASFTSFGQLLRCAHKRIVNIIKLYIERNNMQVELIRFRRTYRLYSRIHLRRGDDFRESRCVYSIFARWQSSSSFVSFTQCSPTCGRMPVPSLSLWPGRQPYTPSLVGGRRGGGPSSVAPRSRNPPTGHRRDSPISSSLFLHGQPLCAVG